MPKIIPDVLKNLFSKPFTLKYPFEKREMPERNRGKPVVVDREDCVGCGLCTQACPAFAISLDEDDKPVIDLGHCAFCGLCAENCPRDIIEMSQEYELATFDREEAVSK